jgi:hypothetical protein
MAAAVQIGHHGVVGEIFNLVWPYSTPPYPLVGLSMAPDFEETLASAPATGLRPVLEKVPDESPSLAGWLARGRYTGWPPCLARGCGQGSDAGGTAGR